MKLELEELLREFMWGSCFQGLDRVPETKGGQHDHTETFNAGSAQRQRQAQIRTPETTFRGGPSKPGG
jgi:hypothetical protein